MFAQWRRHLLQHQTGIRTEPEESLPNVCFCLPLPVVPLVPTKIVPTVLEARYTARIGISWAWAAECVDFPLLQKLRCPEFCSMRLLAACVRIEARWIGS